MAKSYYLLIQAGEVITTSSRFFRVSVGDSSNDMKAFHFVRGFCEKRGYYFHPVSEGTYEFLEKCLRSVYGYCDMVLVAACLYDVSVSEVRMILTGCAPLPDTSQAVANASRCMVSLSVGYCCAKKMGEKMPKKLREGSRNKYGNTSKQGRKWIRKGYKGGWM